MIHVPEVETLVRLEFCRWRSWAQQRFFNFGFVIAWGALFKAGDFGSLSDSECGDNATLVSEITEYTF